MPTGDPNPPRRHEIDRSDNNPVRDKRRALREIRRAEQFAAQGDVPEAIRSLEEALHLGADRYTCFLRLARLYQTRQQWPEAVRAAERAIAEDPGKLTAREAIISFHLENRDYERAIDASKALLKIAPRHVPARDALGAAYLGLGDVDAAMRVANDLIRLDPASPAHRFTKAHLCQHRGEVRMAVEEFQRVVALAPESDAAEAAREQLDALDAFQLNQILTLACDDSIFRAKLEQDSDAATAERGFCLSDSGRDALRDLVSDGLPTFGPPPRPVLYN
jgi:tetratricopeptide (TPR) repeat protein